MSQKPSQRANRNNASKQNPTPSQTTLEQSFKSQLASEDVEELVNKCVQFVLYRAGTNLPIRRAELQKQVLHNIGRNFDMILNKAGNILKDVYGYDIYLSNDSMSSNKLYLVSNTLSYMPFTFQETTEDTEMPEDVKKILIMLVLAHVFMSNNNVNEASLFAFLRSMQLDPERKHKLFGDIKDFVTSVMVKQKYLTAATDGTSKIVTYSWGARAEHDISKHTLLKFVCKVYKDRVPSSWITQYENANRQMLNNTEEDDIMEIEEDDSD